MLIVLWAFASFIYNKNVDHGGEQNVDSAYVVYIH